MILQLMHSSGGPCCCGALSVGDVAGAVEAVDEDIVVVVPNDRKTPKLTERNPSTRLVGRLNRDRRRQVQAP